MEHIPFCDDKLKKEEDTFLWSEVSPPSIDVIYRHLSRDMLNSAVAHLDQMIREGITAEED